MGLIREVNNELVKKTKERTEFLKEARKRIGLVFEEEQFTELFETVDAFLKQIANAVKNGETFSPEQAKSMGAKLASLQLLADSGTRGAALSELPGSDSMKKIADIIDGAKEDSSIGPIDKSLILLANRVGKSGASRNEQILLNLPKMKEAERASKASEILSLVNTFKQIEAKVQQASQKK